MKLKPLYIACITSALCLTSCSGWFDVSPKTDIKAEELFETEEGFQSALAGIYITMTDNDSYGRDLTFGLPDQLAQLYDMIPDGTLDRESVYNYSEQTTGYDTKSRLANIWLKQYNLIANANNLLKWLDKNGERVITNPETREMMYGEAYALRAFLHFDLLRGWGPTSYPEHKTEKSIPYRTVADNSKQPLLAASEVVEKIEADLQRAEEYLSYEKGTTLASNERRFRLNYYAVKAIEARVYAYAGEASKAVTAANEVISNCGLSLQSSNSNDPALFDETLFGVNKYKMEDYITSYFTDADKMTTQYYTGETAFKSIFEVSDINGSGDMRTKRAAAFVVYTDLKRVISRKYLKNDNSVIPIIRLPEMYYILCEASSLDNAAQYINTVRTRRGISQTSAYGTFTSDEARTEALDKEYRKEFYAEGQYWYFLKRHNITSLPYASVTLNNERFTFALPDNETEYGWTAENEVNE